MKHGKRTIFLFALLGILAVLTIPALADITFDPEIHIKRDCAESEAEVVFRITIPGGTPVGSLPSILEKLLAFYRDLWTGNDAVIRKELAPRDRPALDEIISSSKALSGVDAIILTIKAFRQVEEQGFTTFPQSITITSTETLPVVQDCLLDSTTKKATANGTNNVEKRIPSYRAKNLSRVRKQQLTANLNSVSIALLSYRSQYSRFPANLKELITSGHLLIIPTNPFTGKKLTFTGESGAGTFSYSKPSDERYVLTTYDADNLPMKRELIMRPDVPIQGLLSVMKPAQINARHFTDDEQTVRIYIFQISQHLNSFYETSGYIPRTISHMEAQGYTLLNYKNPFTNKPIQPSQRIDKGSPGSYYYMLIGEKEYILGGFGEDGRKVIEIHRKFIGNSD